MSPLRVAFAGGGTGGHVVPGLHLLSHARRAAAGVAPEMPRWERLVWFGTGRRAERTALGDLAERAAPIPATWVKLALEGRGGGAPSRLAALARAAPATLAARRVLRAERVELVLGLGGLVQLPVVLAARSLRLPIVLLEVNAVLGTTTRRLAPLATRVLHAWRTSLPDAAGTRHVYPRHVYPRHVYTGPPLARAFAHPDAARVRAARERLGLAPEQPLLLVIGGSQGAAGLNRFVAAEREALTARGAFVLHQVGPGRLAEAAPPGPGYRAEEYLDDVPSLLSAATLVLCRGGASTLAEVAAARTPAWVVPYPHHADQQQERNARELGEGVRVVRESALDSRVARELARLASQGSAEVAQRAAMSAVLAQRVPLDGAESILALLEELVPQSSGSTKRP